MKNKLLLMTVGSALLAAIAPAQDSAADLQNGLAASYPLNGTIRAGLENQPKAAVMGRTLRLAADRAGNPRAAYHLDFNSWMLVAKAAALEPASALTVSDWVKPDRLVAPDSQTVILTKRFADQPPWNSYMFVLGDGRSGPGVAGGQAGHAMFCLATLGAQTSVTGGEPLSTKDWTHLAGTYDGAKVCLFVNGKMVASEKKSGPVDYGPFGLFIGATTDPGERFLGDMSEVRIYHRALAAAEIEKLFALKPPAPFVASSAPKEPADAGTLRGAYVLVSVDGQKVPCTVQHEGANLAVKSGAFNFNADGTCSSQVVFTPPSGADTVNNVKANYARQGSELTMQWEGAGMTTGTLVGDTFTMNNVGMVFVYQKSATVK